MTVITLRDEPQSVVLGRKELEELISLKNGEAALLYLYILKNGGRFSREEAAKETGIALGGVDAVLEKLVSACLVAREGAENAPTEKASAENASTEKASTEKAPAGKASAEKLPSYPPAEIRHTVENDSGFSRLLTFAEAKLKKVLSPRDEEILLGLYDALGFSSGVLMLLLSHCVEKAERERGEGARVTLRQVEREAFRWRRLGVLTECEAEVYIREEVKSGEETQKLMRLLRLPKREPTDLEREYLEYFLSLGMDSDVLEEAYDRTVFQTKAFNWKYMASILRSWSGMGIKTAADVLEKDPISAGPGKRAPAKRLPEERRPPSSKGAVSAANKLKNRAKRESGNVV